MTNHLHGRTAAPATLAVSLGRPDQPGSPANVPPFLTTIFLPGGPGEYARSYNPTVQALEDVLAGLEGRGAGAAGATQAIAFASGMGAISAVADLVPVGGVVVAPRVAYSGTRELLAAWHRSGRIQLREVGPGDFLDPAAAAGADLVWLESPANPTLEVIDIPAAVAAARASGALVVADATFATPLGCRPLDLGCDVVVHSATKYLSGHSDVLLGAVLLRDGELAGRVRVNRTLGGAVPGPMEAWLGLRGLRTFPLRFTRACESAIELAARLQAHPALSRVRHLSLPGDPGHELASRQLGLLGAIIAVEFVGGVPAAQRFLAATELWTQATSLGGVESTCERRSRWAAESPDVPADLVRLSVGIEDVADLWADLAQALDRVARG